MIEKLIFFCFLFLTISSQDNFLLAQKTIPLHFEALTINNGLSQGYVSCIMQDKKGFMWFATSDGLNMYDGYNFTIYHHDPQDTASLADDDITFVYEDSHERLWVCTRKGAIDLFDREYLQFIHIKKAESNNSFSYNNYRIKEDINGILWYRTADGLGCISVKQKKKMAGGNKDFLATNSIHFIQIKLDSAFYGISKSRHSPKFFETSSGNIFIYNSNCLYQLHFKTENESYSFVKRFDYYSTRDYEPADLIEDRPSHTILIHLVDGVYKFEDNNYSSLQLVRKTTEYDYMWGVDNSESVWMSDMARVVRFQFLSGKSEYIVADNPELNTVLLNHYCFYTDRTGILWIGTIGYGILKYDPGKERFHTMLRGEYVYKIFENNEKKIVIIKGSDAYFISSGDSVLYKSILDENILRRFGKIAPGSFNSCQDNNGNFWFSFPGFLFKYDTLTKKADSYTIPIADKKVSLTALMVDSHNNLWMGSAAYLIQFNTSLNTFSKFEYPVKSDDYNLLQIIMEDTDGIFWLGAKTGMFAFDSKTQKWKYWFHGDKDTTSLSNNFILSFCKDPINPSKYLWIGTRGGGLNRLEKTTNRFTSFTTKNGLPNNVIYGILPDKHGNLWLSTNRGLSQFNPMTKVIRNFNVSDGLQGNEFNVLAFCKTKDDFMVFGGVNGINYFNPDDIKPLEQPAVEFTDFRLFNKPANFKTNLSPLKKNISFTKEITLDHRQNMFTIQFAAMDYRKTSDVYYRYQMIGFDKSYIYSETNREATYTNLNPGTYTFMVQASNSGDSWGNLKNVLIIRIIPPWWRTDFFYAFAIFSIVSIIYVLYNYRINQLLKLERMRNRIARDLHDEIGSSLSTISIYSKVMQEKLKSTEGSNNFFLKKISETANQVQDAMNDIVWSINTKNDEFESLVNRMREHAVQLLDAAGYTLHFNFDETLFAAKFSMERRKDFYLIYKEAVNNIAKYAQGKNVWISLTSDASHITLTIKDDGKGFDTKKRSGSGNGLHNMQSRAEMLNGSIQIISAAGEGTNISLQLFKK